MPTGSNGHTTAPPPAVSISESTQSRVNEVSEANAKPNRGDRPLNTIRQK